MASILKPDQSVLMGVASAGVISAIYAGALPTVANVRASAPQDNDIEGARKAAAWTSFGLLSFLYILTRDRNAFMIGGIALAGIDLIVKTSNGLDPLTGALTIFSGQGDDAEPVDEEVGNVYPIDAVAEMGY